MDFKEKLTFNEFDRATYDDWKIRALKELKKDDLGSLQWKNKDDIEIGPYYDDKNSIVNPAFHHLVNSENDYAIDARHWENRQYFSVNDTEQANTMILEALKGGADGIILSLSKSSSLTATLKDVEPDHCSVTLIAEGINDAEVFSDYISKFENPKGEIYWQNNDLALNYLKDGYSKSNLPGNIKPFGFMASTDNDEIVGHLLNTKKFLDQAPDELKNELVNKMSWQISISEDYFQGIVKVKVLRQLLFQVFSAYNIDLNPSDLFIYVVSPVYSNEDFGPHENMLKATTASMAAIIGGCNAIYVEPQDIESRMQRRVARNVTLILKEEAYLSKNMDPSAGSYFLESLIDTTAKEKWQKFQDLV